MEQLDALRAASFRSGRVARGPSVFVNREWTTEQQIANSRKYPQITQIPQNGSRLAAAQCGMPMAFRRVSLIKYFLRLSLRKRSEISHSERLSLSALCGGEPQSAIYDSRFRCWLFPLQQRQDSRNECFRFNRLGEV